MGSLWVLLNHHDNPKLDIDWRTNKWVSLYCMLAAVGTLCYGHDTIYYAGIQGMKHLMRDYGYCQADGTYALATTFLSISASII